MEWLKQVVLPAKMVSLLPLGLSFWSFVVTRAEDHSAKADAIPGGSILESQKSFF